MGKVVASHISIKNLSKKGKSVVGRVINLKRKRVAGRVINLKNSVLGEKSCYLAIIMV